MDFYDIEFLCKLVHSYTDFTYSPHKMVASGSTLYVKTYDKLTLLDCSSVPPSVIKTIDYGLCRKDMCLSPDVHLLIFISLGEICAIETKIR